MLNHTRTYERVPTRRDRLPEFFAFGAERGVKEPAASKWSNGRRHRTFLGVSFCCTANDLDENVRRRVDGRDLVRLEFLVRRIDQLVLLWQIDPAVVIQETHVSVVRESETLFDAAYSCKPVGFSPPGLWTGISAWT